VTATQYWRGVRDVQAGADAFGYNIESLGPSIGAVFGLGLFWRTLALYILYVQSTGRVIPASVASLCGAGRARLQSLSRNAGKPLAT
jgi:hypothetical protein